MVRKPKVEKDEGTEQTRARVQLDPVVRMATLWARDHPDIVALENAARELRRLFVMETAFLGARAVDLSAVRAAAATPLPEWLSQRRRDYYIPWVNKVGPETFNVIVNYFVDEISLDDIDRNRRKRKGTAKGVILDGLLLYAQYIGAVRARNY